MNGLQWGKNNMATYTLFWPDGRSEVVEGNDIVHAINKAGYGRKGISALDFYTTKDSRDRYRWDQETKTWKLKP